MGSGLGSAGKLVALLGVALIILGGLLWLLDRAGVQSLPGNLKFSGAGWSCYIPILASILLSIVLTLLLNFFLRWFR